MADEITGRLGHAPDGYEIKIHQGGPDAWRPTDRPKGRMT